MRPTFTQPGMDVYICPRTGAPLRADGEGLTSGGEAPTYEVRRGIPMLLIDEPLDEENTGRLDRLNETAVRVGWREALDEMFEDEYSLRYVTDPSRLKILDLLELTKDDVALDFGASLGTFTVEMARRARHVHAIDISPGQAEFTAERCRQEGAANVTSACGGDQCRLPYADGTFDAVFFNLVFEWCVWRSAAEDYEAGQRRVLSEILRVLKPGGRLLLSTKNRYALHYLKGGPDEHMGNMRFGNALPRFLTRRAWRDRLGRGRALAGLLHSHDGLSAILQEEGFKPPRSFWAAPEMRFPRHYVPTDAASIREARRRPGFFEGQSRIYRLVMPRIPASLVKHFTPGLTFVAVKPG